MKKALFALLMSAGLFACSKDNDNKTTNPNNNTDTSYKCTGCTAQPEAKAEYNNSTAGVYKGVLVGSTGTIALHLYNTGTELKALVAFDGKNATLTSAALGNWSPGKPISNALFTGKIDGKDISAMFSVDSLGKNPRVTVQIPGHDVKVAIYKETSTTLIKNYEGTYTGDRSGTYNLTLSGNDFSIVTSDGDPFSGTLVNGKVAISRDLVEINGEFKGDEVTGTWKDGKKSIQGTWSGKRTL